MEILCPNCQRKLTILEQYAGQQMKCPLCASVFTAPALPSAAATPVQLAPQVPQPAPAPPPPPPPPPPASVPPPVVAAPPPPSTPPAPQEPVPTEHTGKMSVRINAYYTQFVPPALLFVVLVLTFFPWVGIYPGGLRMDSQSAWQVLFGWTSTDADLEPQSWVKGKQRKEAPPSPLAGEAGEPSFDPLMLFYLLLLLANLLVVALAAGAEFAQPFLPPAMHKYLRWRWPAAAVVTLLTFGVLLLVDAIGFSLERRASGAVEKLAKESEDALSKSQKEGLYKEMNPSEIPKIVAMQRGLGQQAVVRTFWFRLAFWLHFWALVFVVLTMLADLRSPRPSPRVDVLW